jgi:nicotinate-nucleotide adenylyltransferase
VTTLFGGAFDPPHLGHVALLEGARKALERDRIVVLVVADPGHKAVYADATARLALARMAFPGEEVELDHHARTVDLLREERYPDPLLLVGADELVDLLSWKEPEAVLELARLAVATRPGYDRESLQAVLKRLERPERVTLVEIEAVDVTSTQVRERVARGEPIDHLVPRAVAEAIRERGLYRS